MCYSNANERRKFAVSVRCLILVLKRKKMMCYSNVICNIIGNLKVYAYNIVTNTGKYTSVIKYVGFTATKKNVINFKVCKYFNNRILM